MTRRRRPHRGGARLPAVLAVTFALVLWVGAAGGGIASAEPGAGSDAASWSPDAPVLGVGASGPNVRTWQHAMNEWLAVDAPGDPYRLTVDGVYGLLTDSITRRFQFAQGIPVDGLVGPVTRAAYLSAPDLVAAGRTPVASGATLTAGDRGDGVLAWQHDLDRWVAAAGAPLDPVAADGVFGPRTEAATRYFQQAQGVTVDGIVGPETRAALASAPALVNAPPVARPSSSSPTRPAAGTCSATDATIVDVVLGPDVPAPRCAVVAAEHWLRLRNDGPATHVTLGSLELDLAAHDTVTTPLPVGAYVDPGVHTLVVERYGGSGPDLRVQ